MNSRVLLAVGIVAITGTACGVVPKGYRGDYVESESGLRIELSARSGKIISSDGSSQKLKASDVSVEDLKNGKPGIYFSDEMRKDRYLEIFWIQPTAGTSQGQAGLFWYEAQIMQTLVNASVSSSVAEITFKKCSNGRVMIDLPSQTWQAGCPEDAPVLLFKRIR